MLLCMCVKWAVTGREQHTLRVFEKRILKSNRVEKDLPCNSFRIVRVQVHLARPSPNIQ
jgi:hypothetical protein